MCRAPRQEPFACDSADPRDNRSCSIAEITGCVAVRGSRRQVGLVYQRRGDDQPQRDHRARSRQRRHLGVHRPEQQPDYSALAHRRLDERDGAVSRQPKPFEHRPHPAVRDGTTHRRGANARTAGGGAGSAAATRALPLPAPSPSAPSSTGDRTDAFVTGRKLAEAGHCPDAIPYYDKAIQANPRYAKAYSDRGRCYAKLGNPRAGSRISIGRSRPRPMR